MRIPRLAKRDHSIFAGGGIAAPARLEVAVDNLKAGCRFANTLTAFLCGPLGALHTEETLEDCSAGTPKQNKISDDEREQQERRHRAKAEQLVSSRRSRCR